MRTWNEALSEHRGTLVTVTFVAAFVIAAGTGVGGPGSSGPIGPTDCKKPVYDTPCGKELADDDPANPCLCESKTQAVPGDLELSFEVNAGQAPEGVRFVARPGRLSIELGRNVTTYRLPNGRIIEVELSGAQSAAWQGLEPQPGRVNYLLGNDPRHWYTGIATYRRVTARNIYPGIDILYYGKGRTLEHDLNIAAGADPTRILYAFRGVEKRAIDADGELVLSSGDEEIRWRKPVIYQGQGSARRQIAGGYRLNPDGSVGFTLGAYDRSKPLVIDPIVLYSSFLGRTTAELGHKVAFDGQGNVYLVGQTVDAAFPTSSGVFKTEPGATDKPNITITKLRADTSAVVFSTYIGGKDADMPGGVAVDAAGNLFIAGYTGSVDFPVTANAYQRNPGNPGTDSSTLGDGFVLKLNAAGSALVYSSFLGGSSPDTCTALAVDSAGNVFVAGVASSNMPNPEFAFQRLPRPGNSLYDAFAAKLDSSGSRLLAFTYFGGNGFDAPTGIAVDRAGNSYLTGFTNSTVSFPVTADAYQPKLSTDSTNFRKDRRDAFLLKFNPDMSSLLYGTYLGGPMDDLGLALALDAEGSIYITGSTNSANFPVTTGAFQTTYKGAGGGTVLPGGDAFVTKLSPDGKSLIYSTYLGGAGNDRILGIALDAQNNAWLTGSTLSADFPLSNDAAQRAYGGVGVKGLRLGDAFVSQLSANGRSLLYSTFIGGAGDDIGMGVAIAPGGGVLVTGGTTSVNFPVSPNAAQRVYGGTFEPYLPLGDMFLMRIGDPPRPVLSISGVTNLASSTGGAVAPGELVVITGVNIGPATAVQAREGFDLPSTLGETRAMFDGIASPLISVSATQVTAVVPFGVSGQTSTQLVMEYRGDRSAALSLPVVAAIPGLFSADQTGKGSILITSADGTVLESIKTGDIITLFGTGAGATDPPSVDGQLSSEDFPPLAAPVTITIGDTAVEEIYFSGGVKGRVAGIFQTQFRVPPGVNVGQQPIVVRIGDIATQDGLFVVVND